MKRIFIVSFREFRIVCRLPTYFGISLSRGGAQGTTWSNVLNVRVTLQVDASPDAESIRKAWLCRTGRRRSRVTEFLIFATRSAVMSSSTTGTTFRNQPLGLGRHFPFFPVPSVGAEALFGRDHWQLAYAYSPLPFPSKIHSVGWVEPDMPPPVAFR